MLIERNIIHDNYHAAGCDVGQQSTPTNPCSYGWYGGSRNGKFINNVLYNLGGFCLHLLASSSSAGTNHSGFTNLIIANNTCAWSLADPAIILWNNGTLADPASAMSGLKIHNNIFLDNCNQSDCSTKAAAVSMLDAPNGIATDVRANVIYAVSPGATTTIGTCSQGACGTRYNADINSVNTVGTNPNLTTAPTLGSGVQVYSGTPDFTLTTSSTAALNTGSTTTALPYNGSAPDVGAFESATFSSATIDTNLMDVTLGMSTNVPVLPASGITGFSVSCTGTGCGTPTVASANKLAGTDSKIRLTISGITGDACDAAQTWTVSYSSSTGNMTDSANIGTSSDSLVQPISTFSTQPVTEVCTGSGTTPPATNLLIHYLLDESSGTNANDEVGTGTGCDSSNCDGTHTNTPTKTTGKTGNAIQYGTSTDNYTAIPYGSGINPTTQSLSACMWASPDAGTETAQKIIFSTNTTGTNQRFYIGRVNGFWSLGIQSSSFSSGTGQFQVAAGWSRVCIVANSGTDTATLYVNGVKGTSTASVKTYTSYTLPNNLRLGNESAFSVNYGATTVDDFKLWTGALTDQEVLDDYNSYETAPPAPTGTFEQKTHRWRKLRKTAGGAIDSYGDAGATVPVMVGGAVILDIQVDCTTANCDPLGLRLHGNANGGAFSAVPDSAGSNNQLFYGATSDSDILNTTVSCCLTGALTQNDGTTLFTSAAIPVFDLAQDASVVQRYVLKVGPSASAGDTMCFKVYSQDGNALDAYTPSAGACLTVVGPSAGIGF
jgi:hypothetical protein